MKNFFNIFKKELRELLTKQLLIGLVFMVLMFGIMGSFVNGIQEEEDKPINLAVLDLNRSSYSENILKTLAKQENITIEKITKINIQEAIAQAKEKEVKILLVIPENFEKGIQEMEGTSLKIYSIIDGFSLKETISGGMINRTINVLNNEISVGFIQKAFPGKDPGNITNPLQMEEFLVIKDKVSPGSPSMVEGLIVSQLLIIPIILMMMILYAGGTIMTSMALEKENKTLETLLTLPVKRISIIIGKMAGAATVAFLMAAVFLMGFKYYMSSAIPKIPGGSDMLETLGLNMSLSSYILLGISLFLAILIALTLCLILGMFAQDTKSAQIMNMPIILMVMIPFFILMFKDIESLSLPMKIFLYAIPFSHPIIASKALIFDNYFIVFGGMIYMIIFAVVLMSIAIKLFNTDKILTAKFSIKIFRRQKNFNQT